MKAVTTRTGPTAAFRPVLMMVIAALLLTLAGAGYLAWRQNTIVPPVPTPSPSPSVPPSPAAIFACPPGAAPDLPGPADQARPPYDPDWRARNNREWRAAVDAGSGVLVVAPAGEIWVFDLCTNTWRRTGATTLDGRVPVYDPGADVVVMLGSDRVTTFDAERDAATELGRTPVVGNWEAVYDSAAEAIVARDELTSRVWTYQVATDEWREITQSGDTPPAADVECDIQLLGYDSSVERVWLVHDPGWCLDRSQDRSASTYELDLHSGSWQRLAVATPGFRAPDWAPPRMDSAYDEANGLSVVYDGLRLTSYDAVARRWEVVYTRPGINSRDGGLTHFRVPLAYDPINRRVVMVGGDPLARSGGYYEDWVTFGDITSIDLATQTWTELLAGVGSAPHPSDAPQATPAVFACPPGSEPNLPGPAEQRLPADTSQSPVTFDWRSGSVVAAGRAAPETWAIWTFDVCANRWDDTGVDLDKPATVMVYGSATDSVLVVGAWEPATSARLYDTEGDTTIPIADLPDGHYVVAGVYRDVDQSFVVQDERGDLWKYDAAVNAWQDLREAGDQPPTHVDPWAVRLLAYDESHDTLVAYTRQSGTTGGYISYNEPARTYEFDFDSSTWTRTADPPRLDVEMWGPSLIADGAGGIAYDVIHDRTVLAGLGMLISYRVQEGQWQVLAEGSQAEGVGLAERSTTLAYDATNQRIFLTGAAGHWAFDMDGGTWLRLARTPIVESTVDAAGDASPASAIDIVLVTTSVADGMLTLEVTLAQDWPTSIDGSDLLPVLFVEWVADDRPHAGSGFGAGCGAYVATYRSAIAPDGTVSGSLPLPAGQVADVSGPVLTLTVPLEAFENPTTLGFALSTASQGGDRFPDDAEELLCHDIPLTPPD